MDFTLPSQHATTFTAPPPLVADLSSPTIAITAGFSGAELLLFGAIDGTVAFAYSSVVGEMSVLFVAIVLLRLLPMGITGRLRRGL